jgi:hypothetical protein
MNKLINKYSLGWWLYNSLKKARHTEKLYWGNYTNTPKDTLENGRAKGHVHCTGKALSVHLPVGLYCLFIYMCWALAEIILYIVKIYCPGLNCFLTNYSRWQ